VPRTAQRKRLPDIAAAATDVFGRLGYQRTRTADIASQAGLSPGGLFTYVDSKDALFHLVFVAGLGHLDGVTELPATAPPIEETLRLIRHVLRTMLSCPKLRAAARLDDPADLRVELAEIIEEQYSAMSWAWPLLAVVERSASDIPALEELYFDKGRHDLLRLIERYLARRVRSGHFRQGIDTAVDARVLLEMVTWFGWHRHEDRDEKVYGDDQALAGITRLLCDALVVGT
jgi:AcrR family transcriptional regulator